MSSIVTLSVIACWTLVFLGFRGKLRDAWCEPILRRPALVIESDDWGPAGNAHALALQEIAECLRAYSDREGRHPVMTLGIILATVDVEALVASADDTYHRVTLEHESVQPVREAMLDGVAGGVFALQLHGLEHYRVASLLAAAGTLPTVQEWLRSKPFPDTEALPSHLQSRWTDASTLPSRGLDTEEIERGVKDEMALFESVFGERARVYVPTTFVWPRQLEAELAREGVEVMITPGFRCGRRAADGSPEATDEHYLNGDCRYVGMRYLVRDIYFEPAMGHTAWQTIGKIRTNATLGRPSLLETHRNNFTRDKQQCAASLNQLHQLLADACRIPEMAFVSSLDLAHSYAGSGPIGIETRFGPRISIALRRLMTARRFYKLAWLTGLAFAIYPAMYILGRPRPTAID